MSSAGDLQHVQQVWDRIRQGSPIYNFLLSDISIVHASKESMKAILEVREIHLNSKGTLHGTVSGCLLDWAGGLAIVAASGMDHSGLSVHIDQNFSSTAKLGDTLEIEGQVLKLGGTLAFTNVTINKISANGPVMVAYGSHTKFLKR